MVKLIIKSIFLLILIGNLNAQNHLNKSNLPTLCNCDPSNSTSINLANKSIETIDPATFNGLSSLQKLSLQSNQISYLIKSHSYGMKRLVTCFNI